MNHTNGQSATTSKAESSTRGASKTSAPMEACEQNCTACVSICEKTLASCIQKGGAHVAPAHLEALLDCIDSCRTSAAFLARGSALHKQSCELCAAACQRCADSCNQMADDSQMKACAAACLACVASCKACC